VARSGQTTAANLRLRCRAHNQFEAERRFGKGFMESKRREASHEAAERAKALTRGPCRDVTDTDEARPRAARPNGRQGHPARYRAGRFIDISVLRSSSADGWSGTSPSRLSTSASAAW